MEGEQLGKTGSDAQAEAVRRFGSNDLAEGGGCRSAIISRLFSLINTTSYTTKSSMIVNNSMELLASLVATFCMYAAVHAPRSKTHEPGAKRKQDKRSSNNNVRQTEPVVSFILVFLYSAGIE